MNGRANLHLLGQPNTFLALGARPKLAALIATANSAPQNVMGLLAPCPEPPGAL
jgi:hypothetical protein